MRRPSGAAWDGQLEPAPETEYAREAAKAKIQSITGRMFQLLDDYDEDTIPQGSSAHAKGNVNELSQQVKGIDNNELKTNIQAMIVDYNEMCHEREDLLCSLADWFEEGHIDDLVDDAKHRRMSVSADPVGLRQSLLEGKKASERLKEVNTQMDAATSHGEPLSHLQKEKEQLEKELMKSMKFMETTNVHQSGMKEPADTAKVVNDSWKYAAVEICGMLHQVRDSGSADMQLLESKINDMISSMNQQASVIEQLNSDLTTQKEMVTFADMTTSKLSGDNFLLKEELDTMRGDLLQAKKLVATLQAQVEASETETEMAKKSHKKDLESCKCKTSDGAESQGMDTELHKAQLSDLNKRAKALEQENDTLKASCKTLEEEVKSLKDRLQPQATEGEFNQIKSTDECGPGEDTVCSATQSVSYSGEASAVKSSSPATAKTSTLEQESRLSSEKPHTQDLVEVESLKKEREEFLQQMTELHQQLQSSCDESAGLRTLLGTMEAELLALRRENHELLQLQEKSADMIRQASQVITFSEPARDTVTEIGGTQTRGSVTTHVLPLSQNEVEEASLPTVVVEHRSHDVPKVRVMSDTGTSWSAGGSVVQDPTGDYDEFEFTAPTVGSARTTLLARTNSDKKVDSCKMVMDLLQQLNENNSDLASADSEALTKMQHELQKVCQMVAGFLEFSTGLVNDEADVMSKAMSTLMTHLPEGEKPALRQVIHDSRSQSSNLKLNPSSYWSSQQTVLKKKVALFADQAIEALKESEKMLSSKIHSQHKKLQTVMHVMAEHKKKQSQAFKFPLPEDVKGLVLEAKALSSHDISEKANHREHSARTRLERMKFFQHSLQHSPPYSYAHAGRFPTHPLGGFAFGGLRNHPSFIAGTSTTTTEDREENNGLTQLQIDTTHHHVHSQSGQTPIHNTAAEYMSPHSPLGPQLYMHSHQQQVTAAGDSSRGTGNLAINTKHRSRKPKLHKPFHSHSKEKPAFLQVGGYVPPKTAPGGATGRGPFATFGLQGRTGVGRYGARTEVGRYGARTEVGRYGARTEAPRGAQFEPSGMSNRTTFYDILAQSNTLSPREHHHRANQSPASTASQWRDGQRVVKLPPL